MTLNLQTPFPIFEGSTGGWLRAAEVEEKYAITWKSSKEQIFEMPTGGAAINATIKQAAAVSRHGIIKTPNQPTYNLLSVEVTHSQNACQPPNSSDFF